MAFPIQYALTYPNRHTSSLKPLNFAELSKLEFSAPRIEDFPAINLARQAGLTGGTLPAVFNAANEIAVDAFRAGNIRFPAIWETVAAVMQTHPTILNPTLEQILSADLQARISAKDHIATLSS
jgi:1-deoxy-D-xylulose-5-phosphate reductoisomerase